MRTKRQKLYDAMYYGFERWLIVKFQDHAERKRLRGVRFDREFYREYRASVRPYWARYGVKPSILWVKHNYLATGSMDPRYIPEDIFAGKIMPHFNNELFVLPLADKNLNSLMFPGVKRPETVLKCMNGSYHNDDFTEITREEAVARCAAAGRYFLKPTRSSSEGDDILAFSGSGDTAAAAAILDRYAGCDYIVQRAIVQHPALAALNASSVNTLRLITLVFRGEPVVLSSILRIGGEGSDVDNIGAGGYQCRVLPDGTLDERAYTKRSGKAVFVEETDAGIRFRGTEVPSFRRVCDTALELAAKTPHLRYIAWDFAVDEDGDPVLVEFNSHVPGQNQATCGPTFGDLTEDVLAEVFCRQ